MGGLAQVHADHRASPSSSAGWPSPACRPFAGFWSKDEILAYACDESPALWRRRPGHRAAHRLLHEPPGVPGRSSASATWDEPIADDVARRDAPRPRRRRRRDRDGHGRGRRRPRTTTVHPHESPWTDDACRWSCWPSSPRSAGLLNLPFADEHAVPRALARAGRRPLRARRTSARDATIVAAARRRRPSSALTGIAIACARLPAASELAGRVVEPELFADGLVLRQRRRRLHGRPRPQALRRRRLVRPHGHRRRGQRRRPRSSAAAAAASARVQTGYVRSYALGVAIGAVAARRLRPHAGGV